MTTSMQRSPEPFGIEDIPRLLLLNERGLDRVAKIEAKRKQPKKTLIHHYAELKRLILAAPFKGIVITMGMGGPNGGDRLCRKIKYCDRKAWFSDRLKIIEKITEEKMVAGPVALEKILKIDGGAEMIEATKEFVAEAKDLLVDYVIPISLIVKVFKYGLDDLCNC